ncbi:type II toxin-antitoxin system RatA family toxin [Hylemonella gracilis]|jgi:ribosome-associated toxin RatA of RatAB toxin-antitoxin module|uniref:Type II toxin-antitoxin system RatA family toxin n=1 Tax=Hylemonella gracilis TaxID=80880 RepID=A0A4P6UJB2_9BURK|nr:type II toxin-antitoxin system RatA family toxin [Hylemonella gracilis]QBK05438.1 type II toxin-antitoxin system RatA family toxin [Hylemonella gracilis]
MKTVKKSVLIWFSPQQMFDLVTRVADYPQFLPWCDRARVIESRPDGLTAEVGIAFSGLHQAFTTRNTHQSGPDGNSVHMTLVDGPFSQLDGHWSFTPVGGSDVHCKVELTLEYGFTNALLGKLVGPVFDKIAGTLVDAFVKRAEQVYGTA